MTQKRNLVPAILGIILIAVAIFLSACSKQQVRDLEGITVKEPQKVELYTNVDQYPNVVALCINGVGFVSTTRDYTSLQESPGLTEKWCAS
jgi:hypothetical protein